MAEARERHSATTLDFLNRSAREILFRLAMERKNPPLFGSRWKFASEPLRNDAGELLRLLDELPFDLPASYRLAGRLRDGE